ncbi:MAG TPA: hypothetical protein VHY09_12300, partial [Candidatus Methylacidiphilales bacterium]|nr:hypothetical protein [Candidatus Methylacidiphilales bacterium]
MAIQRTPSPPKKSNKTGLGCLGCGCLLVVVVFLLFAGLVGGTAYMGYKELNLISSPTAETIAPYTGGEDVYTGAQKKLAAFNQDVTTGKTSTLTLSSDELNALLYHSVDLKKVQAQALVTLTGDLARLQGSIPSNQVPIVNLGVKDRYFNLDATTGISFN